MNKRAMAMLIFALLCQCCFLAGLMTVSRAVTCWLPTPIDASDLPVIAQAPFRHGVAICGGTCLALVVLLVFCVRLCDPTESLRLFTFVSTNILLLITTVYLVAIAVAVTPTGSVWRSDQGRQRVSPQDNK
jgi:hypothetical protein